MRANRTAPPALPPLGIPSLARTDRGWGPVPQTWFRLGALGVISSAALTIGTAGLWYYARRIEPRWIDWNRITLPIPQLPAAFNGYRIVHLSDLHLGSGKLITPDRLSAIVQRVNRYRPDLVAITGDFVTAIDPVSREGMARLSGLRAPDGVYGVPGNHDYWAGVDRVQQSIKAAGGTWLINDHRMIRRRGSSLIVAGIDDPWEGQPDLNAALRGAPIDTPVILLAHPPNTADAAIQVCSILLQLSGHSHGGQVRIPGIGPLMLPDQADRYPCGLYHVPRAAPDPALWVNTNRGLGLAEVPYRFNCRPEVTIITLTKE